MSLDGNVWEIRVIIGNLGKIDVVSYEVAIDDKEDSDKYSND